VQIFINGKIVYEIDDGEDVSIDTSGSGFCINSSNSNVVIGNNTVFINGKNVSKVQTAQNSDINIEIRGNAGNVKVSHGNITVMGDCNNVKTSSGDIRANTINGNAETASGDIKADRINGDCSTLSGDIKKGF